MVRQLHAFPRRSTSAACAREHSVHDLGALVDAQAVGGRVAVDRDAPGVVREQRRSGDSERVDVLDVSGPGDLCEQLDLPAPRVAGPSPRSSVRRGSFGRLASRARAYAVHLDADNQRTLIAVPTMRSPL